MTRDEKTERREHCNSALEVIPDRSMGPVINCPTNEGVMTAKDLIDARQLGASGGGDHVVPFSPLPEPSLTPRS